MMRNDAGSRHLEVSRYVVHVVGSFLDQRGCLVTFGGHSLGEPLVSRTFPSPHDRRGAIYLVMLDFPLCEDSNVSIQILEVKQSKKDRRAIEG